jgi:glycosyltransferase involved in cell wall biosynthesis
MAVALERLWRDPALRERMGRAARERALGDFAPEAQVAGFVAMLEEVVPR